LDFRQEALEGVKLSHAVQIKPDSELFLDQIDQSDRRD
jgi:hypothetical protein